MTEPVTTTPPMPSAPRSPVVRFLRRFAAAMILSLVFFVVLWMTVFNAVNSALVASGGGIVLVAGSSASESFQSIFEAIAEFILGIFGAICDFFSSLFD
jgi:Flp pilus assembly protein TadB